MDRIEPSDEQQTIINHALTHENLAIIAVAGAGKTTTILLLARACPERSFFVLTYNRRLSDETKHRIKSFNVTNVEMYTYHGFCTRYFAPSHNDATLSACLTSAPHTSLKDHLLAKDVLIIDEMQDMNDLYYQFIHHKLVFLKDVCQIVLLGDPRQTIYQFNGGNDRYLLDPQIHWNRPFTQCYLDTTYRLPHKITNFVNTLICNKYPTPFRMKSVKTGDSHPVEYYFTDLYKRGHHIITKYIRQFKIENVLVIACSVKEKTPVYKCLNLLSEQGVNMCVLKDDATSDPEVLQNKLVASTIHKQKGCERQCVIVYGLDCSYHKYYGKNKPLTEYLNLIYVACTRSLSQLVIIGDKKHGYLKNWHPTEIQSLISTGDLVVHGAPLQQCDCSLEFRCLCAQNANKYINVGDLIKYRPFSWINELLTFEGVTIEYLEGSQEELNADCKVTMRNGLVEHVSVIYSVLIPTIVEFFLYGKITMIDYLLSQQFVTDFEKTTLLQYLNKEKRYEIRVSYREIQSHPPTTLPDLVEHCITQMTFLTICLLCYDSYVYLFNQIDHYDWIDQEYVVATCQRLVDFTQQFPDHGQVENKVNWNQATRCLHPEQVSVNVLVYGRVADLQPHYVIDYHVTQNFADHMHIAQMLLHLWVTKKRFGYLYYPNLDKTVEIIIDDDKSFALCGTVWINRVLETYYQLTLNEPTSQTKTSTSKHNICLL